MEKNLNLKIYWNSLALRKSDAPFLGDKTCQIKNFKQKNNTC